MQRWCSPGRVRSVRSRAISIDLEAGAELRARPRGRGDRCGGRAHADRSEAGSPPTIHVRLARARRAAVLTRPALLMYTRAARARGGAAGAIAKTARGATQVTQDQHTPSELRTSTMVRPRMTASRAFALTFLAGLVETAASAPVHIVLSVIDECVLHGVIRVSRSRYMYLVGGCSAHEVFPG